MSMKKKPKGVFDNSTKAYTASASSSTSSLTIEDLLKARESLFDLPTKKELWDVWGDPVEKFNTEYLGDWRYNDYIKPNDYVFGHPTYHKIKAAHYFDILAYRGKLTKPVQVINASMGASIELAKKVLANSQTLMISQRVCRYICL